MAKWLREEVSRQKKDCDYWFAERNARRCLTARRKEERRHAKTVLYCSLGTPRAASQSQTAVYSGGGVAPRSVNSWRCFDNSFISVVRSSATYLKSALRFNSSSAST